MSAAEHWGRIEQPILQALAAGDGVAMSGQQLAIATGIEEPVLMRALRSLMEDDFIAGVLMQVDQEDYPIAADGIRLRPKGLRQADIWPREDLGAAFVAALEKAILEESDEQERSKLEGVLGAVKRLGGMTLSAVIANAVGVARSHLGLG
jgi:hypothetical protein